MDASKGSSTRGSVRNPVLVRELTGGDSEKKGKKGERANSDDRNKSEESKWSNQTPKGQLSNQTGGAKDIMNDVKNF